jgi:hypothetical protein
VIYTAGWNAGRGGGWKDFSTIGRPAIQSWEFLLTYEASPRQPSLCYGLVIEKSAAAGDQSKAKGLGSNEEG